MHRLVCLGLSHRTAPVELRERLGALGAGVERCPAVAEHAALQTCYRVELYARLTSGVEDARDELVDALAYAHEVPRELLVDHLYVHAGEDVARHLCRVAAGLDSLVLGEAEILGQVGDALAAGQSQGSVGPGLELLFRTAISAGRRARSETAIGENPATASSMALALAEGVLGDLRERHLLVVGAGRIGRQTLTVAASRGLAHITVANRTNGTRSRGGRALRRSSAAAVRARGRACGRGRRRRGDLVGGRGPLGAARSPQRWTGAPSASARRRRPGRARGRRTRGG